MWQPTFGTQMLHPRGLPQLLKPTPPDLETPTLEGDQRRTPIGWEWTPLPEVPETLILVFLLSLSKIMLEEKEMGRPLVKGPDLAGPPRHPSEGPKPFSAGWPKRTQGPPSTTSLSALSFMLSHFLLGPFYLGFELWLCNSFFLSNYWISQTRAWIRKFMCFCRVSWETIGNMDNRLRTFELYIGLWCLQKNRQRKLFFIFDFPSRILFQKTTEKYFKNCSTLEGHITPWALSGITGAQRVGVHWPCLSPLPLPQCLEVMV